MSDLHNCNQCKFTDGSEVSKRVCAECFDKTSWEPKPTVYTVDIDLDVQTRINLNPCPLPRIGSKEWGWHPSCYTVVSTRNNYHLVYDENNQMWLIYDVDGVLVATSRNQSEAQNIAELLTRRDWRRENRGKR